MTTDGTYTAVVDRFEEELAVLLLEADGETVRELVVEQGILPEEGRHVDAVLDVKLVDGKLVDSTYKDAETVERSEDVQRRFDDLSQRPPSDEDKDEDDSS